MEADTKYVCINSFPKSGNTFTRSILSYALYGSGFDTIPDGHREDIKACPIFYAPDGTALRLYKYHSKFLSNMFRMGEIEHYAVIYIQRHPLDVFLSWLNYLLLDPEDIENPTLRSKNNFILPRKGFSDLSKEECIEPYFKAFITFGTLSPQFQVAGSWVEHWNYWKKKREKFHVVTIRYEDLARKPRKRNVLSGLAKAFGKTNDQMNKAFYKAQKETKKDGKFFWQQTPYNFTNFLSEEQVKYFYTIFNDVMEEMGYPFEGWR